MIFAAVPLPLPRVGVLWYNLRYMSGDETTILRPGGFFGAYRVVSLLGRGGMGEVYLVEDPAAAGARYAVKVLGPEAPRGDGDFLRRFVRDWRDVSLPCQADVSLFSLDVSPAGRIRIRVCSQGPGRAPRQPRRTGSDSRDAPETSSCRLPGVRCGRSRRTINGRRSTAAGRCLPA